MRKRCILAVSLSFLLSVGNGQISATVPNCQSNYFYDSTQFKCMPCGDGAV